MIRGNGIDSNAILFVVYRAGLAFPNPSHHQQTKKIETHPCFNAACLVHSYHPGPSSYLVYPERPGTLLLLGLLLDPPLKGHRREMVPAERVKVLDLVDSDNPVFAGKCFFQGAQLRTLCG